MTGTSGNIRLKALRLRKDGSFELTTERVINKDVECETVLGKWLGLTKEVTETKQEQWVSKTGQHWIRYPDGVPAREKYGRTMNEHLTSLFHEEMSCPSTGRIS